MREIKQFDGTIVPLKEAHYDALRLVLLETGKFVEVGGNLINIASIESVTKSSNPIKKWEIDITALEP